MTLPLQVPDSFRAMPRWWHEGEAWLDGLPALAAVCAAQWRLEIDGEPWHGSNALVVPVTREGVPLALRLTPPGPEVAELVRLGAYRAGTDPAVDEALRLAPRIEAVMQQDRAERTGIEDAFAALEGALDDATA